MDKDNLPNHDFSSREIKGQQDPKVRKVQPATPVLPVRRDRQANPAQTVPRVPLARPVRKAPPVHRANRVCSGSTCAR